MRPKPRNLQFHTYPKPDHAPARGKPQKQQRGNKIMGQADSSITNLKGKGKDKICVICGNGPSLSEAPLEKLAGLPNVEFIAINIPDPRVWPAHYWILLDSITMRREECARFFPDYQGLVITNHIIKKDVSFRHLVRAVIAHGKGFGRDMLRGLNMGKSSGFVAAQVALYMGYKDIYFFGLDMHKSEDGKVWNYGENAAIDPERRLKMFEDDARHWNDGVEQLTPEERAHFHICSEINPWPFAKLLDRLSPAQGVEQIVGPEKPEEKPEEKPVEPDETTPSL